MRRITLRLLLLIFALSVVLQFGETAQAAQTINGKAIGSVDDVVKEISRGDLSLPKKGLITLRGLSNNDNTYLDVFASVFGADGSASGKRKIWSNPNPDTSLSKYENEPTFFRPAVSRRLYNGKRALMFHNTAFNGSLKYFFTTLSNTRGENSTETTPNALVNSVQISDFGEYILPTFSNFKTTVVEVQGAGVMSVKGYDHEIFVGASKCKANLLFHGEVRLDFFAISADNEGAMKQEPLTNLVQRVRYIGNADIVSIAVGDFDGDKYNNEVALMMHFRTEIKLFVYRLNYSNGKLEVKSLDDLTVHKYDRWWANLEEQPVADMTAGGMSR